MMTARSIGLLAAALAAMAAAPVLAGEVNSTIDVVFWDKPDMDMATGLGHGMGGDMSKATMGFTLSVTEVPAGEITFNGRNDSKAMEHEMIVAPLASADQVLPYNESEESVDEDAAMAIGEIPEVEPGESDSVTLHLQPGEYILFCNVPGHYMTGMWTVLKVN